MQTAIAGDRMPRASIQCRAVRRLALITTSSVVGLLLMAPMALAHDGGEGYYGQTDDRVVTYAGFALIVFFPLFVFVASMIQGHLEKRKDERLAASRARAKNPEWQRGW
jgi:hypothetical protein